MANSLTCAGCGKSFHLKEEMAGRKVRCPECQFIQVVPASFDDEFDNSPGKADGSATGSHHPAFNHDRFLLRQKLITVSEKYVVWDDQERPILFVERPAHFWRNVLGAIVTAIVFVVMFVGVIGGGVALASNIQPQWLAIVVIVTMFILCFTVTFIMVVQLSPKRHIAFYTDENRTDLLLQVLQDKKFQPIVATYTVLSAEGDVLGCLKKNHLFNLFRKKWDVFNARGEKVIIAREDSVLLSLLRRFLGSMMGLLRTNFILLVPQTDGAEKVRGEFNRNFTLFDRYVLDLSRDRPRLIDRRLAVALGILLDTGENR